MKKILAILLALTMIVGLGAAAFASSTATQTTGSITIKNATKGHTYTAYKVFDATYAPGEDGAAPKVSYTTSAANADLLDDTLFGWSAEDANGNISVWALETAAEADIIDWVEKNYDKFGGTAITGVFDATNSTVTFADLDFGYYYITSSLGTTVTIDTTAPNALVYDKNDVTPTDPVKTIVAVDGNAVDDVTANGHVGSTVDFKITAKTANWTGSEEDAVITQEWEITDTFTNMELKADSFVVKFGDLTLTVGTDYTLDTSTEGQFILNVPMVDSDGNSIFDAPKTDDPEDTENGLIPIEITYSAVITKDAGLSPAKNEIPGTPVIIYTYGFQLSKVDENGDPLEGAQFQLLVDDSPLTFIEEGDTYTYYNASDFPDATSQPTTTTTLDMTTNTTIKIVGLDNTWDYVLKEITVPAGYNKIDDIDVAGEDLDMITEDMDLSTLVEIEVENKAGSTLPSTGGIGTTIFYIVGGLMAVGAGVVLVTKKRMSKEEN